MIKNSSLKGSSKRVVGGVMTAVKIKVNGLMRAAESILLVVADGVYPL